MAEEQSASARIAELLRNHDDLDKVASLKTKLQKEKAVVDGQLKAGVQAQISVTLKAMERLSIAKQSVETVRGNMDKVDKLRVESTESVEHFDKINRLSRVLQNFEDTQRFIDNFKEMGGELQEVEQMMAQDGPFDPGSSIENLITIHYKLSQLWDVKDDSWYFAERSTDDVRRTIKKHFAPLDKMIEEFDIIIMDIATELLEIIRAQNPSLVVRAAKIIDYEEKQDLACQISKDISQDDGVLSNLKKKTASHRQPREYPRRFFEQVESSVKETFKNCKDHFEGDIDAILDNVDWIFADLELAQTELTKCVPSRWKIFDKFVQYYHYQAYELLNYVLDLDPNAASILHILQFVKDYGKNMEVLGVTKDKLQPPLLDGRENKLYDEYLSLIVAKLREWRQNLATTEKTNFIERQIAPETDGDNKLGMQGEVVMFSIISQQIDVAADSGQGRILAGCVEECSNILLERQRDWEAVMKEQVQLQVNDTAAEDNETSAVPGGLVEYLIALGNDQIKGADYTEAISSRITPIVSKKYNQGIQSNLDRVCDGFIALAKSCITGLITIIFTDLVHPFKEIFNSSAWLKGRPIKQIVDTIQEYLTDCELQLNPIIFDVFIDDLLEETVLKYLGALNGCDKIKPKGIEQITKDVEQLYLLFTGGVFEGDQEHAANVQQHFKIFAHLMSTLDCEEDELLEQFQSMRNDFWDAPLDLFQHMVKARNHMDKQKVKEIMRVVRQDALQNQNPPESGESTFLSRFSG